MKNKIDGLLKIAVEKGDTAGANVLVLKDGNEVAYCESGFRDIENNVPITRDTIFRLYSQTKPITAAAVMLLVSQGKIDLNSWLSDYMPEYADMYVNIGGERRPAANHITAGMLMNMSSGIAYPDGSSEGGRQSGEVFWTIENRLFSDNPVTTAEFAEMTSRNDLCFEPGEQFMYGASADILGALVEKVSGMSFRDFLRANFFEPMDMNDTDFYVPAEKSARLAKVYDYSENGLAEVKTNHLGLRYERDTIPAFQSGGAGLCSTLDDYAKFASMLLNGGRHGGRRIMPEAAVRLLTCGGQLPRGKEKHLQECWSWMSGYTYGNLMRVCEDESRVMLFSSKGEYGWDGWLGAYFANFPEEKLTILMGTQKKDGGTFALTRKLRNLVLSETFR